MHVTNWMCKGLSRVNRAYLYLILGPNTSIHQQPRIPVGMVLRYSGLYLFICPSLPPFLYSLFLPFSFCLVMCLLSFYIHSYSRIHNASAEISTLVFHYSFSLFPSLRFTQCIKIFLSCSLYSHFLCRAVKLVVIPQITTLWVVLT